MLCAFYYRVRKQTREIMNGDQRHEFSVIDLLTFTEGCLPLDDNEKQGNHTLNMTLVDRKTPKKMCE